MLHYSSCLKNFQITKTIIKLLLILTIIPKIDYGQVYVLKFDHTVTDILAQWRDAGSPTFKSGGFNPRLISFYKANDNVADHSVSITDSIIKITNTSNGQLALLYLDEGTYTLNSPLVISGKSNLIIKGAGSDKTKLVINHGNGGIVLSGCSTIGIEDLTIYRSDSWDKSNSNNTNDINGSHNVFIENSEDCWFNGVFSYRPLKSHIRLFNTGTPNKKITISGCTFQTASDHSDDGGEANGITMDGPINCLIENNIFNNLRHSVNIQLNSFANVIAYNGSFNSQDDQLLIQQGDLCFHGRHHETPGPNHNLVEGNIFDRCTIDGSHCNNGPYNLLFRNKLVDGLKIYGNPPLEEYRYCSDSEFSNSDQEAQNVSVCTSVNDQTTNVTGQHFFNGTYTGVVPPDYKSYYCFKTTLDPDPYSKPDYLPDEAWPYYPGVDVADGDRNAAQLRVTSAGATAASVYSYAWNKYACTVSNSVTNGSFSQKITGVYKAYLTINTSGNATVKSNEFASFVSGNLIELNPGFSTENGAIFTASISSDPCGGNQMSRAELSDSGSFNKFDLGYNVNSIEVTPTNTANVVDTEVETVFGFPNPFNNYLTLEFQVENEGQVEFIIYNSLMQKVIVEFANFNSGTQRQTLDTSMLNDGLYFYCLKVGNGVRKMRKIIKQNLLVN